MSWCRNEQVCQGRKSVKRFERSDGLDTALYKNIPCLIEHDKLLSHDQLLPYLNHEVDHVVTDVRVDVVQILDDTLGPLKTVLSKGAATVEDHHCR